MALAAQYRVSLRVGISAPVAPTVAVSNALSSAVKPTHWKRGALIGAVIGASAWIAINLSQGCGGSGSDSDCVVWAVGLSPVFGLLGAIPGALIGGLFPKGEKHDSTTLY